MFFQTVIKGRVYSFSGYLLNINVSTRIHQDHLDTGHCLILNMIQGSGGHLCFLEPGIVLELPHGDIVIFSSSAITHFNLHYIGRRASLVFHTDKAGESWVHNRNGWDQNISFRTSSGELGNNDASSI
jgi:hypothetical protein